MLIFWFIAIVPAAVAAAGTATVKASLHKALKGNRL